MTIADAGAVVDVGVAGAAEGIAETYIRHNGSHTVVWIVLVGMLAGAVDR